MEIFTKHNCSLELMHCVSTYPMKPNDANLTINSLKNRYNDVCYSGHENGIALLAAGVLNFIVRKAYYFG